MPKCNVCGKQLRSDRDVCPFCKAIIQQKETPLVHDQVGEAPPMKKKARELAFGYSALAILSIALNPMIAFFINANSGDITLNSISLFSSAPWFFPLSHTK